MSNLESPNVIEDLNSNQITSEISLTKQRELIDELGRLIAERAKSEDIASKGYQTRDAATQAQFSADERRLNQRFKADTSKAQDDHTASLGHVIEEYESGGLAAAQTYDSLTQRAVEHTVAALDQSKETWEDSRSDADARFAATEQRIATDLLANDKQRAEFAAQWSNLDETVHRILRRRRCRLIDEPPRVLVQKPAFRQVDPHVANEGSFAAANEHAQQLTHLPIARVLHAGVLFTVFIGVWLATLFPLVKVLESQPDSAVVALIASAATALVVVFAMLVFVRPIIKHQSLTIFDRYRQSQLEGEDSLAALTDSARESAQQQRAENGKRQAAELQLADGKYQRSVAELNAERDARLKRALEEYQAKRASLQQSRERKINESQQRFQAVSRDLKQAYDSANHALSNKREQELDISRQTFDRGWARLVERWKDGLSNFATAIDHMNRYCDARFPPWNTVDWRNWLPPRQDLQALRFGHQRLRLNMFSHGLPTDDSLKPERSEFHLPAVLSFPKCPSLLLEAYGEGRESASRILQNVMLRFLTAMPAGKVRFTILDAVGLGRNFSAFMHLADYDEKIVSHRIWSEPAHINQRLLDLTEHMQDVIQTYLRNEFASIEEYNKQAGEVAEPYHVLVIANFPAGFSEEAAQRLVSIANSGARCGVYTLISTDSKLDLPRNFDIADLEGRAATLQWDGTGFSWLDPVLKELPLVLEQPPPDDLFTEIVRTAGRHAKDAGRVEVPFGTVAPKVDNWWTQDSRAEIEVPLGRAGASKLQHLRLGKGTSQHVLIAGKTGSGKSTLLHAMIINLALHYSPNEIQFYLIDFKKGVEFKPYATQRMPHACVVAIESEREFGMSVLERLDAELRRRGDMFRAAGVQDIKGYRDSHPQESMPRVLLVIDEFQEFFVQDDKLAQDAALLLDRLVRQGRAFGIHVLLGSQTLAGAYSLARSTLGQMAVRIALQCSEADSHLILSEENTAARLLNRPGEAIYNDANGLFEGNHPFQVVWLGVNECENYLKQLSTLAEHRRLTLIPPIVFEGSAPADPAENDWLKRALTSPNAIDVFPQIWLGSAVSIKEPTSVAFRRQSGSNLLIVGQQEGLALGILANCVISAAATSGTGLSRGDATRPRLWIFDGSRTDSPDAAFWSRLVDRTGLTAEVVLPAGISAAINQCSQELARRAEQPDENHPAIIVLVYNLSRFRELRRSDDDFGFSSSQEDDKPKCASKQFVSLLRDGPALGIYVLIWSDSLTTVTRWFDRQTVKDFDHRVLFQMGANDSSNLIDSPAAGRLGVNRAILYSEESGQSEKFRPYGPPGDVWLAWVRDQLRGRAADTRPIGWHDPDKASLSEQGRA